MEISSLTPTPFVPLTATPDALTAAPNPTDPHAIDQVASNFEALLLGQLLKEMRQTVGEGGMFPGDTGDVQGGLFDMFMSQHLAQAGGFGLASMLKSQLNAYPKKASVPSLGQAARSTKPL
jgi:Rod binding domain-containing protein